MANLTAASGAALFLILIALIVCIVSMATDHWADVTLRVPGSEILTEEGHRGLIKMCTEGGCTKYEDLDGRVEDYISGTLACMCLAFLSNGAALVTMILWVLDFGSDSMKRILKVVTILLIGIAIFWYVVALVVFAAEDEGGRYSGGDLDYTLSWSWGIVILAAVLDIFGIVLVVFAVRKVA